MVFRLALAWGCSPREVLARVNSTDLAEWVAFERAHGPIDNTYERIMLNDIQHQLQIANYLAGANFVNEDEGIENPVDHPTRLPLPWETDKAVSHARDQY